MGRPDASVREWAGRLRDSDPEAAKALFNTFYPRLVRYACRITHDADTAEDVVQEAFLNLWKIRARLDPERSVTSLLFVMVRNLAHDATRSDTRQGGTERTAGAPDPSEGVDSRLLAARLREWIDALPQRRREAFHLSRFEELSYQEIAQVMDVSVRTVENHIRLALQDLRDHIRDYEPNLLDK